MLRGAGRAGHPEGFAVTWHKQLVAPSTRTAAAKVFSFRWRVQSPAEISSRVTVPSFEPQATVQPLSCRRRLERGSSQTWGGITGCVCVCVGWWHLALMRCPMGDVSRTS